MAAGLGAASLAAGPRGGCPAAGASGGQERFVSAAGLQTVVLGTTFISLGFAPLCRLWTLQTCQF